MGESDEITKRRHPVGTSSPSVGACKRRQLLQVFNTKDLGGTFVEGKTDGGTGRRDVLEGRSSRKVETGGELLDERPRIEGVKEVDVAGGAGENLNGHFALLNESLGRLLVRVGAVPQTQPLVSNTGASLHFVLNAGSSIDLPEVVADSFVVALGVLECLDGKSSPGLGRDLALGLELSDNGLVVGRGRNDGDTAVVLGSSTKEGDTANVNLLNGTGKSAIRLGGLKDERVEVADNEGDGRDLVGSEVGKVRRNISRKDTCTVSATVVFQRIRIALTTVNSGVEGLDSTTQHLRGLGDVGNIPE